MKLGKNTKSNFFEKIISKYSSKFGINLNYFLQSSFWLFLGQGIMTIITLALTISFTRYVSVETYGQFQFILSILGIIGLFIIPGINNSVLLNLTKNKDFAIFKGIKLKLKFSIISIFILIICSLYFYFKDPLEYKVLWVTFLILIPLAPILYSFDLVPNYYIAKKKFYHNFLFQIGTYGLANIILIIILLFFTQNLIILVFTYFLIISIGFIINFLYLKNKLNKNKKLDKDFLRYGFHLSLINFIPSIKRFSDKIIITFFLGFSNTAIYSIANSFSEQINTISKSFNLIAYSKICEISEKKRSKEIKKKIFLYIILLIIIIIPLYFLSPFLMKILFSNQYDNSIKIAQNLLLITILTAVGSFLIKVMEIQKQTLELYKINITYSSIEILGFIILIPIFGITGIIISKLISNSYFVVITWIKMK